MASIFTKIINREIPCYLIGETDDFFAFLDIRPLAHGHTLCVPKKEVDYLFDLDDKTYVGLHLFAKEVAMAIEKVVSCKRVGVLVIGTEVPHAHIHLIPFQSESQMNISYSRVKISPEEMTELARKINAEFVSSSTKLPKA